MSLHPMLLLPLGLVVILAGAELLLRCATRLAEELGISPLVIGLTVVSLGTSAPELAIGITAAGQGQGGLAVGNIAGTNIFNILFILGLSAALRPLAVGRQVLTLDLGAMTVAALALAFMSLDGRLGRAEGVVLVVGAVAYTVMVVVSARRSKAKKADEGTGKHAEEGTGKHGAPAAATAEAQPHRPGPLAYARTALGVAVGIGLTVWGAQLLVDGASQLARAFGISDVVIGLTVVAIGTSAPELVTTLIGTLRNQRDLAIGNLIGSSTYNILAILGLTIFFAPEGLDVARDVIWWDLPIAAAVPLICHPVFRSGREVSRIEGAAFVLAYLVYLGAVLVVRT